MSARVVPFTRAAVHEWKNPRVTVRRTPRTLLEKIAWLQKHRPSAAEILEHLADDCVARARGEVPR